MSSTPLIEYAQTSFIYSTYANNPREEGGGTVGKIKLIEAALAVISAVVATIKAAIKFASCFFKKKRRSGDEPVGDCVA